MKRLGIVIAAVLLALLSSPAWAGPTTSNDPHATSPKDSSDGCGCGSSRGMPVYSFKSMLAGLNLRDTPLSVSTPVGPGLDSTLTYNTREADQPTTFDAVNVGRKWTLNWISYIQDEPDRPGVDVKRYVAGGGARLYDGYQASTGEFAPEEDNAAVLVRTSASPITYELRFSDGARDVFAASDDSATAPRKVYLTQIIDPQGNGVTLNYDSRMRLTSVTDAVGRSLTFAYDDADFPLAVTGITGPAGRFASFGYDDQGRLISITDAIGMTSTFTYGDETFITAMTTPYGTTRFQQTKGEGSSTERSVQATDPMGYTERTEYRHNAPGIAFSSARVPSGMQARNAYLNYRNSFYWDKSAYAKACTPGTNAVDCDYTKARIKHFLHNSKERSQTARSLESIKYPLESRIWYRYRGQSNSIYSGTLDKPIYVGRVLSDGTTQLTTYAYNDLGRVIGKTGPNGRGTDYTYAANGIDLIRVERKTSGGLVTLARYTYNDQHRPLTQTDAAGQTTTYTYNARGQRTSVTDALGNKTLYHYDANGYLTSITNALGDTRHSLTYDAEGRIASDTDSQGYTRRYQYDALNRITAIQYPDGTRRQFTWKRLDLASVTDREGRTTSYTYDADRKLLTSTDPAGQVTRYGYYRNGELKTLTDPNGNTTTWVRDIEGRVTQKIYADGNGTTFTYDAVSRLASKTDALGQITHYTYTVADLLAGISYTDVVNPTPPVQFTYDPDYRRPSTMSDGHGTTAYTYYAPGEMGAGQLKQSKGDDNHDTLQYTYDALGRVASRTVDGSTETYRYDALGRLTSDANALGNFTTSYLGDTAQPTSTSAEKVPYQVAYQYEENLNDRRLKAILNDTVQNGRISPAVDFRFTSQADGLILSRTETGQSSSGDRHHHSGWGRGWGWGQHWRLPWFLGSRHHDLFGWLTHFPFGGHGHHGRGHRHRHHDHDRSGGTTLQYTYDDARRLIGVNDGNRVTYTYDAANNLLGIKGNDNGTQIAVNSLNQIQTRDDTAYQYDADGNLLDDGRRTYTWDAANRLLTITDKSTGHVSAFAYDGLSRRVSDTETDADGTATVTHNLWCARRLCERRADDGAVTARYFTQGEMQSGTPYYYAKDQVGSVVALIDADGNVAGRTTYDAYGNITAQTGVQPGYAYAGLYHHQASGLYLATYRAYDPAVGRWLSRDPAGEFGGLNLYSYASAYPIGFLDPYGLWDFEFGAGAHIYLPFTLGAAGPNASSSWTPGEGLRGASFNGIDGEYVIGSVADAGVNAGIGGFSSCPQGKPKSVSIGAGRYGGIQINYKGGHFDGISVGLGVALSMPVTFTIPLQSLLDSY